MFRLCCQRQGPEQYLFANLYRMICKITFIVSAGKWLEYIVVTVAMWCTCTVKAIAIFGTIIVIASATFCAIWLQQLLGFVLQYCSICHIL